MADHDEISDRKLRILHVLRAPLGGLFRHVLDLTREQIARGHSVGLVVDSTTGGETAAANLAKLAPILELGIKRMPMLRAPHLSDAAGIFKVDAHARRLGIDVIHGHGSKGGLYARTPGLWRRRRNIVRCYTPHGGSFNHVASPVVQAIYMGVERALANVTDVLLFESVYIANRFHDRIGEPRSLIRIVQNGISEAEFVPIVPGNKAADFLYVGELRAAKGIDTLIDATAMLTRKLGRHLKLTLVGSGPDQAKLEHRARSRGISANVAFAGAFPAREAFTMGRTLVVPSRAESLPYIVLEAAGAQIPMIATDVGGIGEVFGPHRHRLIKPNDPVVLARAMEAMILADPASVEAEAQGLADYVATRFMIAIMADSVIAGYRDALARQDPTPARSDLSSSILTPS